VVFVDITDQLDGSHRTLLHCIVCPYCEVIIQNPVPLDHAAQAREGLHVVSFAPFLLQFGRARSRSLKTWEFLSPFVNTVNADVLCFHKRVDFPSWTSRVRVLSPAPFRSSQGFAIISASFGFASVHSSSSTTTS
jgi:hypothetical protein